MEHFQMGILLIFVAVCAVFGAEEKSDDPPEVDSSIEGLKISITKKAKDCTRKAKNGDQVSVHYSGFLMSGKEFDSSKKRNQPFVITLGAGMVIQGWEKGIPGMCVGEERKLVIAPELAYGEQGFGDIIPGGSTLIFDVEMLDITDGMTKADAEEANTEEEKLEIGSAGEGEGYQEDLFQQIDTNGDGQINVEEMAKHLMVHEGKSETDDKDELYTMVGEIFQEDDKDKDGVLSYHEFMAPQNEHDEL